MSLPVKEFWKSVNIWGSYGQESGVLFFWDSVIYYVHMICYEMLLSPEEEQEGYV